MILYDRRYDRKRQPVLMACKPHTPVPTLVHTAHACSLNHAAERKSIEAAGIAEFQRIVSEGISDQLLKWKGIETTKALAESENAKIVVVGSGVDGLPVIFNSA